MKPRTRRCVVSLVAAAVLLLLAPPLAILGVRAARVSRLREVVERRVAEGLPTTLEDLHAMAPRVDSIEQERLAEALKDINDLAEDAIPGSEVEGTDDRALGEWILGASGSPPPGMREALEKTRATVESVTGLARRGRALASNLGRLPRTRPSGVSIGAAHAALQGPSAGGTLRAARWHRFAAVLGDDPDARLADIEALLRMQSPPGGTIDLFLGIWTRYQRDRTHVELALQGRLSRDREELFVAEEPDDLAHSADGWRAEAALFGGLLAEDVLSGLHPATGLLAPGRSAESRARHARVWFCAPAEAATFLEVAAGAERALRGEPGGGDAARLREQVQGEEPFVTLPYPVVDASTRFACLGQARGRAARLAVRLLALRLERGRLPADEFEARAWLGPASAAGLDPGVRDLRLRYERPREDVLRIAVDPTSAPPLLVADWGETPPIWMFGTPPASRPLTVRQEGIEIQLPR